MNRARRIPVLVLAALASLPAVAIAGPHGGRHHGGHHGSVSRGHVVRGHTSRPRVRDHRAPVRPHAGRPYYQRHVYWPYYSRYSYWPYYGYHDDYGYYPYYYVPPGTAEVVAPVAAPPRRSRAALAVHAGQLERDDELTAGITGLALRWRGGAFEGELELGRRVYADSDVVERSLAATVYGNLGDVDAVHPYLLASVGVLDSDRAFGALGAGLALPFASRLTLAGDVRAASIGDTDHHDRTVMDTRDRTLEGRLTLIVDF